MANKFVLKRGTAAGLATLASGNGLTAGEPYFITDQGRITIGLTASTHAPLAKLSEILANPMTNAGDLIIGGASGVATRLAPGSNTYVLTMVAGVPAWAAATGGGGGGGSTPVIDDTAPTITAAGQFWLRPADGVLSISVATTAGGFAWHVPLGAKGADGVNATIGGPSGSIQFNSSGVFSGATNVHIDGGNLKLLTTTEPTAPADGLIAYSRSIGGRAMLCQKDALGLNVALQPHLARNRVVAWMGGTAAAPVLFGTSTALTLVGTGTAASVSTTNRHTQMLRTDVLVTTAATTAVAGFRAAANQFFLGSGSDGGFHFVCRWGPATGVATTTNRAFVGLSGIASGTAPTDVEPSTLLNQFGMGWDAADTNIQFMYNGGTGTATKVDLGSSFPVPTADRTKAYEITVYCPPGFSGSTIFWEIVDLATNASVSGSVANSTGKLPAVTTLLAPRGWMSVGGTSSVIGLSLMMCYVETDY